MRAGVPLALVLAALAGCGGDGGDDGRPFAERANAICEEHNPKLLDLLVEGVAGEHVSRERLEEFWDEYPDAQRRQLDALRELDGAPPQAQEYLDRLERNVEGLEQVREAMRAGEPPPSPEKVGNSQILANQLAEDAGLPSCSPAQRIQPESHAVYLLTR